MIEQINLYRKEIDNEFSQENFRRLWEFLNSHPLIKGDFKFFEYTFDAAVTNKQLAHKLSFVPKDVLQTYVTGGAEVTWNFDKFTKTFLNVTTNAACTVRLFVGRYED